MPEPIPQEGWLDGPFERRIRGVQEVTVRPMDPGRLESVLPADRVDRFERATARARARLAGRVVWNVSSTAAGGGVAEMLQFLLAYARGVGVDTRWAVIEGDPPFFELTKRLHNLLHGFPGDGGPLGPAEHAHYREVLAGSAEALRSRVRPGDIVLLHDPQPAGLLAAMQGIGAAAVWRCHIGRDSANEQTDAGWDFLRRYVEPADAFVFSRRSYAPPWVDPSRLVVIPPSIDPFSTKNADLTPGEVDRVLRRCGLLPEARRPAAPVRFRRRDGSSGTVGAHSDILLSGPPPPPDARLVLQVSRWDRLKDMAGVMEGFARHLAAMEDTHLMLAGPAVVGVADDPEGAEILASCLEQWAGLPWLVRSRVHLACIPMEDSDENALIVNALQRHARAVVQKSLVEGFGLTVTEAMWKARPIVASAVGGIQDQIADGRDGLLLPDPADLDAFAAAVARLLDDRPFADRLGRGARARAREEFLGDRHLEQYADLFEHLLAIGDRSATAVAAPGQA
ncbi:MAG TPA: glycosyltransferase [Frankiaceae bacterium]|nr:glycosyltransferase [Frankiaceae bacterium]